MSEDLKKRLEFPNSLIQAQAVRSLTTAVLKEKGLSEKITQSSDQTPALELLWEKCCSDNVVVRAACCDALVVLVAQDHADHQYVLNNILNLIPSARNVQGLINVIGKLLHMQAVDSSETGKEKYSCPFTIRNPPHPYISVLENRPDCWPALLQQIAAVIQQCREKTEVACVSMLAPFLRYLYCETSHLPEHAKLRQSLLKALLPSCETMEEREEPSAADQQVLQLLFDLVPHLQVNNVTQVVESAMFLKELSWSFLAHAGFWRKEMCLLSLQLLCACELSLRITGECSALIELLERNIDALSEDFPSSQVIVGLSLLLLQAPASQQTPILNLALKIIVPSET